MVKRRKKCCWVIAMAIFIVTGCGSDRVPVKPVSAASRAGDRPEMKSGQELAGVRSEKETGISAYKATEVKSFPQAASGGIADAHSSAPSPAPVPAPVTAPATVPAAVSGGVAVADPCAPASTANVSSGIAGFVNGGADLAAGSSSNDIGSIISGVTQIVGASVQLGSAAADQMAAAKCREERQNPPQGG
jgi:hypothetical protein